MRILFWCPHVNLGGGKRLMRPILTALAKHPDIQTIRLALPASASDIVPTGVDKLEVVWLSEAQVNGWMGKDYWRFQPGKLRPIQEFIRYQRDRRTVSGLLEALQQDMDAVYVFWPHTVPYYAFSKPLVCMFQDVTLLDYPEILGSRATAYERQRLYDWLHGSTTPVVSSMNTAKRIEKHFGIAAERFHLLPYHNSVLDDLETDTQIKPASTAVEALPKRYVFYPANVSVHKNHETLLVAWSRFKRRDELSLVLVGYGVEVLNRPDDSTPRHWRQDALCGLIKRLELIPGRDFYALGYVPDDDIVHIMNRAAALIMPTHAEGFGLPVLEALARGIPVLCSDIPVLHETLVGRSADVLWFDPYSPNDIVAKLNRLLDDYDHYKEAAEAGRTDPRPAWPDVASQYYAVFETAIRAYKDVSKGSA